jgi:hypothetical protein
VFIGKNAFGEDATRQLRFDVDPANGICMVYASTDADTDAEIAIQLTGVTFVQALDFIR